MNLYIFEYRTKNDSYIAINVLAHYRTDATNYIFTYIKNAPIYKGIYIQKHTISKYLVVKKLEKGVVQDDSVITIKSKL